MTTKRRITAEDLLKIVTVEEPRWSPEGDLLAFVRVEMDAVKNLYRRSIWMWSSDWDGPRQFTSGTHQDTHPLFSPDGKQLAFVSTRGDKPQIFLIPVHGGEAQQLTRAPHGATNPAWSPDGASIAYLSALNAQEREAEGQGDFPPPPPQTELEIEQRKLQKEHDEAKRIDPRVYDGLPFRAGTAFLGDRYKHIYIVDVDNKESKPRRLTDGDADYGRPAWSPDGASIWSNRTRRPTHDRFDKSDLVNVILDSGDVQVFQREGYISAHPTPSPDGQWIACITSPEDHPYGSIPRLTLMKPNGSSYRDLNLALDRSIVAAGMTPQFTWAADSASLYFVAESRGDAPVMRVDIESGSYETLLDGRQQILENDVALDGRMACVLCTPESLPELYAATLEGWDVVQITEFNREFLSEVDFVETEEISYTAPDGTEIQGWVLHPPDFDLKKKWPLAVNIHGGPHAMWGPSVPSMWPEWQLHAARGYVVFYCNPRGSDGYGEAFRKMALNAWGEADMHDVLTGVDEVVNRGYIDTDRMAVTGGSYGGFMTTWILGHDQRFAAAVSQRGVYYLTSFYGTSDIPRLIEGEFGVMAIDDPEMMWKYSPLAYAREIHTPLMILHSELDFRVPIAEAEQLYTALKRLDREVQLVRYPREGHELSRSGEPLHRVDRLNRMVDWFDKYCK
ncbi:MAG: S9 family peptidase [Chloroflexi bacterium]|nr:MAG: S9 family peptidase [Chloroflexota bacterium]MBL1196374.1 S9 family peptidase [Chloroflexota bacterium]NOH13669.1 S9 family peptidase [Chloroflexota bacterium]